MALAREHRKKEDYLEKILQILDHLAAELQTNLTPLPTACRLAAGTSKDDMAQLFSRLSQQLDLQIEVNPAGCMKVALAQSQGLPEVVQQRLLTLGDNLGRYDLEGQLAGIRAVQQLCRRDLEGLIRDRETKLRSYQTLGLCTGAAVAILLL